jgi:hypothetical protein
MGRKQYENGLWLVTRRNIVEKANRAGLDGDTIGDILAADEWKTWKWRVMHSHGHVKSIEGRCNGEHPQTPPHTVRLNAIYNMREKAETVWLECRSAEEDAAEWATARTAPEPPQPAANEPASQPDTPPAPVIPIAKNTLTVMGKERTILTKTPAKTFVSTRTDWNRGGDYLPGQWLITFTDDNATVLCEWCQNCLTKPDPNHVRSCRNRPEEGDEFGDTLRIAPRPPSTVIRNTYNINTRRAW